MSMSKKSKKNPSAVSDRDIREEAIGEAFAVAQAKGQVTDVLGNQVKEFSEVDPKWGTQDFVFGTVIPQIKFLQGRILTIIDATCEDKERAKYVKDLVKDAFVSQADNIIQVTIDHENGLANGVEPLPRVRREL